MADVTKTIDIIVNTDKAEGSLDDLNKELKETEDQTKETKEETKKYEKSLDDTSKATSGLTAKLDKMTGGMISSAKGILQSVKALKSFKVALAATGIGLIIVAIGSLVTMFKNSEEGQNRWNKVLRITGTVIDNLIDRFSALGEIVYEAIVNPVETAKKAWASIKAFISNPLETIKNGYEAAKEAAKDFIDEVEQEVKVSQELADLEANTDKLERKLTVERAKRTAEIAELRRKAADDERFTAEQRLQFNKEAIRQTDELAALEEEVAKNRLFIQSETNKLSESTKEDLDEEARLEADLINIRTAKENQLRRLLNEQQTLNGEVERSISLTDQQIEKETELAELRSKGVESQLTGQEAINSTKVKSINTTRKESQETEKGFKTLTDSQEKTIDALQNTSIAIGNLFGKNKAAAIVTTIINGITAAIKTFAQLGYPWGIPAAAAMAATTAAAVSRIKSQEFYTGGYTGPGGKYEPKGIVHGHEWVANSELLDNPVSASLISVLESMRVGGMKGFADGGFTTIADSQIQKQLLSIEDVLGKTQPVLLLPDLITETNKVQVLEDRTTL